MKEEKLSTISKIILGLIIIVGGVYWAWRSDQKSNNSQSPTPTSYKNNLGGRGGLPQLIPIDSSSQDDKNCPDDQKVFLPSVTSGSNQSFICPPKKVISQEIASRDKYYYEYIERVNKRYIKELENILRSHNHNVDKSYYTGSYESITEPIGKLTKSQFEGFTGTPYCKLYIHLKEGGNGTTTQSCHGSKEDKDDSNVYEINSIISWTVTNQGLLLTHNNQKTLFLSSDNLFCETSDEPTNNNPGIFPIHEIDGNSIFLGYYGFFKSPKDCPEYSL